MLLKWLFTLLAILWLYQALRPFFAVRRTVGPPPAPPPQRQEPGSGQPGIQKNQSDNDGEYIDYEEVK